MARMAAAGASEPPLALERALLHALSAPSSSPPSSPRAAAASSQLLAAICGDAPLLRAGQSLFAQLVRSVGDSDSEQQALLALVAVAAAAVSRERRRKRRRGDDDDADDDDDDDDNFDEEEHEPPRDAPPAWDVVGLLAAARVSLGAFLRQFSSLFERLLLDPELLEVATQLKEEFTVATVLFEKFRALWRKLVPPVAAGHIHEPLASLQLQQQQQRQALQQQQGETAEPEPEDEKPLRRRKMSDLLLYQLASVDRHQQLHDAGWLLFLIAKRRLADQYTGLGQLYYLLLGVLHLVLATASPPSLEAEVAAALSALGGASAAASSSPSANGVNAKILEALCTNPKVEPHEVTRAIADLDALLLQLHAEGSVVIPPAVSCVSTRGEEGSSARTLASAVLDDAVIAENVALLSTYYKHKYLDSHGRLDERFYLDPATHQVIVEPKPSPPSRPPSGAASALSSPAPTKRPPARLGSASAFSSPSRHPATPQRHGSGSASIHGTPGPPPSPFTGQAWQWHGSSPPPSAMSQAGSRAMHTPNTRAFLHTATTHQASPFVSQTPVTAAVETSSWVRDTLASCASGLVSPQLKLFFRDCSSDPTDHIARILQELSDRLIAARRRASGVSSIRSPLDENESSGHEQSDYSGVDGSLQKTKNLAVVLFYRVLEALLVSERERLRTTNFSSLLNNETFVASLFACSLEVVLKAHSLITLSFPFLLDTLRVNAFDFGKIVESFVKHVPRLPNALKRHMRDLEQTILDSLAWRADSGLYVLLAGDPKSASESSSSSLLASLTNGAPSGSAAASSAGTRTSVLQLFFRKVLSLAASRIFRLGTLLELDAKYLNQVWTAVKECISSHHALLKDRHLDQVILCSLYGVCKVNNVRPEVTFKRVIDAYKKLHSQQAAQASAAHGTATPVAALARNSNDVIRNIKLDDTDARGDIIRFYNRCYIPTMKIFMLQFQVQDKQMAAAAAVVASATGASSAASQAPPGFTPRREGSVVAASTSDTEIVAEAAADAVEKVMKSYGLAVGPGTPQRSGIRRGGGAGASPRIVSSPVSSLQLFTSAEVQSLPVSVHHTSPKRVLSSNIYMSPLQQARLHQQRSHLTPRSHALYAFGESPARDLALINRAVNTNATRTRVRVPLVLEESHEDDGDEDDDMETSESNSNSAASTPTNSVKRRRLG